MQVVGAKENPVGLRAVCAWCGRVEERKPVGSAEVAELSTPPEDAPVSHTICDRCFVRETAQFERIIRARRQHRSA
jgi:hypothetical protein